MSDGLRTFLGRLPDIGLRTGLQRLVDRLVAVEGQVTTLDSTVLKTGSPVDAYGQRIKRLGDPKVDTDAVSLGYLRKYVAASLQTLTPVEPPTRDAGPGGGTGYPLPIGSFSATPSSLGAGGGNVTFNWSTQYATTVEHSVYGMLPLSGSASLLVTTSTTFTLLLRGPGGISTLSVTVTVAATPPEIPPPTGSLVATPTTISQGQTATLTWASTNATSASINNGVGAVSPVAAGTVTVSPPQTTTYELRLVGAGGVSIYTATVIVRQVTPPPSGYNAGTLGWGFSNNGLRFEWKGVTAFAVLADLLQGREHQAYDYLQWMAASGVTVPRILCSLAGTFWEDRGIRLYPPEHPNYYTAVGQLVSYCNSLGMMPEIVVFGAFTEIWGSDFNAMIAHTQRFAQALLPYRGCFIEMANEWDAIGFTSGAQVRALAEAYLAVDPNRPVACSSATGDSDYYTGYLGPPSKYLTVHIRRGGTSPDWIIAHYGNPSFMYGLLPCVSDEPVNAGSAALGIYEADPQYWYAFAVMSRVMGFSTTFHFEDGLFTHLPSGSAWSCFQWWKAGLNYPSPDAGGQLFAATPAGVAFGPCPWPNSGTNRGIIGRTTAGGGAYALIFGGAALPAVSAGWGTPQVDGFTTGLFTPPGAPPTAFTQIQAFFVPPASFA